MFWNKRHVYLQVRKGEVKGIEFRSGKSVTRHSKALNHPRTLMADFNGVENCFTEVIKEIAPPKFLSPSPKVYVHLLEDMEGDYTMIEVRAFREAAYGAGASSVYMPNSPNLLSKQQLLTGAFNDWDGV